MSKTSAEKIIGLDISEGMLEVGKQKIIAKNSTSNKISKPAALANTKIKNKNSVTL